MPPKGASKSKNSNLPLKGRKKFEENINGMDIPEGTVINLKKTANGTEEDKGETEKSVDKIDADSKIGNSMNNRELLKKKNSHRGRGKKTVTCNVAEEKIDETEESVEKSDADSKSDKMIKDSEKLESGQLTEKDKATSSLTDDEKQEESLKVKAKQSKRTVELGSVKPGDADKAVISLRPRSLRAAKNLPQPSEAKKGSKRKQVSIDSKSDKNVKRKTQKIDNEQQSHSKEFQPTVSIVRNESLDQRAFEESKQNERNKTEDTGVSGTKGKRGAAKNVSKEEKSQKKQKLPDKKTKSSPKEKISGLSSLDFSNKSKTSDGKLWNVKISSWNVNGIRAWLEKDGMTYLHHEKPDVLCVQETKCSSEKMPAEVNADGYHCYFLDGDKEGYSGVGLMSKQKPLSVKYGIDVEEHDNEGRVITAEFEKFYLVTAYVPNAGRGLVRLEYRQKWDKAFREYLKKLDEEKPLILCGDLNVAHEEIDLANPKTNKKNAGFTKEEREGFNSLLAEEFVDSFRLLYPNEKGAYTFWTYMMNARAKNVGWRLDYFVLSKRLQDHLCDSVIRKDVLGSDHCPITLFLHI